MCNNYRAPKGVDLARSWQVAVDVGRSWASEIFPGGEAPVLRRAADGGRDAFLARFGLVPSWAATDERRHYSTMNARSETAAQLPTFRGAFQRRQWAIVPADAFFEPYYAPRASKSERWAIQSADGAGVGIAGLWDRWTSREGRAVESFTMLTINCDWHPLLRRFHRHTTAKGEPNEKRTPALVREAEYDAWLGASIDEAPRFFKTFAADELQAHAAPIARPSADGPTTVQLDLGV